MEYDLKEFLEHFNMIFKQLGNITLDNKEPFDINQIVRNSKRLISKRWNTTYFKTVKEKRVNQYLNLKYYYKTQIKLYRLEFSFW